MTVKDFLGLGNTKSEGSKSGFKWVTNDFPSTLSQNSLCLIKATTRGLVMVERYLRKLSWVFFSISSSKFLKNLSWWADSITLCLFRGKKKSKGKCIKHLSKPVISASVLGQSNFALKGSFPPLGGNCFDQVLSFGTHWESRIPPPVTILWTNCSGSWSYLKNFTENCLSVADLDTAVLAPEETKQVGGHKENSTLIWASELCRMNQLWCL